MTQINRMFTDIDRGYLLFVRYLVSLMLCLFGYSVSFAQTFPVVINNTYIAGQPAHAIRSAADTTCTGCILAHASDSMLMVATSVVSGGMAGSSSTSQTTTKWYAVSIPDSATAITAYVPAGVVFTNPVCSALYIKVLASEIYVRTSIDTTSASHVTIGGANAKVFYGQYYASIDSGTDVTGHTWYKIGLPDNCSQSYGWIAGFQDSNLVASFMSGTDGLPAPDSLTGYGITPSGINLNWLMDYSPYNTTFNIYEVDRITPIASVTNSDPTTGTPANTTLSILSSGTSYLLIVMANLGSCASSPSDTTTFTTAGTAIGTGGYYQYWFDNNFSGAVTNPIADSLAVPFFYDSVIAASVLSQGYHTLNIRAKDTTGLWSVVTSSYFYKEAVYLTTYQYWFDNQYDSAITILISPNESFDYSSVISATALTTGYHTISIRAKDSSGQWSAATSKYFNKRAVKLVNYQYWFDANFAGAVTTSTTPNASLIFDSSIAASTLSAGIHVLHLRSKNLGNEWSVATRNFFSEKGLISAYRYWINGNYDSVYTGTLSTPVSMLDMSFSIPCTCFPQRHDTLYYQVQDNLGQWSPVITDTFDATIIRWPITGSGIVCVGSSVTLSNTASGGTWTSSNSNVVVSGGIVAGVSPGLDTITYMITNSCGTATTSKAITVLGVPSIITGAMGICEGFADTVYDSTVGGTWSSSDYAIATIGLVGDSTGVIYPIISGAFIVTYSTGCGTPATTAITVNPFPNAGLISGSDIVCAGSITTLSETVTGGAWSASTGNATVAAGVVTGVTPGSDSIIYTVTNMCGTSMTYFLVLVSDLPAPGLIIGADSLCPGSSTTLTATEPGGTWSAVNSRATAGSTGAITGVTPGLDTIKYTVTTTACGSAAAALAITVLPVPNAGTIAGSDSVCAGIVITLTDSAGGGTWSSGSTSIATVIGGHVSGVSEGTDTIHYSVTNYCGTATASKFVRVLPLPYAGIITGLDSVCTGVHITLTDTVMGGTWGATNARAGVLGGVVTGVAPGRDTITYSVSNSCTTAFASKPVIVITVPVAGTITGGDSVCAGNHTTLTDASAGGTWNSSNTGIAMVAGGVVTGVSTGVAIISYSVINTCGTAYATKPVTIETISTPVITGRVFMCISDVPDTLTGNPAGGVWSVTNPHATFIAPGILTAVSAGIDTVNYSVTNACGTRDAGGFAIRIFTAFQCDSVLETGEVKISGNDKVKIYPNPNTGSFTIELPGIGLGDATIIVTDLLGKEIVCRVVDNGYDHIVGIDLDNIAPGAYFVKVNEGGNMYWGKVIIMR